MVNIAFSTRVSETASVAYSKANVLYSVITNVFVFSIANYMFPQLTKINARGVAEEFGKALEGVLRILIFVLIPMSSGLFLLARPLCRMIFLTGNFGAAAASQTADALAYFSVGILGFGFQTILSRAFYAQKNAVIPLLTGVAAVAVNAVLSFILKDALGVIGPALALSLSFCFTSVVMLIFMCRLNKYIVNLKMLTDTVLVCVSAAVMAAAVIIIRDIIDAKIPAGNLCDLLQTGIAVIAGCVLYFGLTLLFGVKEAKIALGYIKKSK
jgi:putative peptidoglycan lipid II flippase